MVDGIGNFLAAHSHLRMQASEFGKKILFFVLYKQTVIIAGSKSMSISRRSFGQSVGFIPRLGYYQVMTKFDPYFVMSAG